MDNIETKELIDCYKKIMEYIKKLEAKKADAEKGEANE